MIRSNPMPRRSPAIRRTERAAACVAARSGGVALPLTLLLLLVLTALAHGLLRLGAAERVVATAAVRAGITRLQLRSALEVEMAAAIRDGALDPASTSIGLPGAGRWSLDSLRVEVIPLGRELRLVRVEPLPSRGRSGGRPAVEGLAWTLDPIRRAGAIRATIEAGGAVDAPPGAVSAFSYRPGPEDGPACSAFEASLDSLAVSRPRPPAVLEGVLAAEGPSWTPLRLGVLGVDTLSVRLDPLGELTTVTPGPVRDDVGACLATPTNWGDPSPPLGACAERGVAAATTGPFEVVGGEGQGLLLVAGDLVIRGGAYFSGIVLVGGDLLLSDSARVRGSVRAGGSVRIAGGSRVAGAACPVVLGLDRADLGRPVRLDPPFILHP